MTQDPLVDVTRVLADAVRDPGDLGEVPAARDEAIAKLAEALRLRARRARRRRLLQSLAVAAGVLLFAGGAALVTGREGRRAGEELGRLHEPGGVVTVVREGRSTPLDADAPVAEGSELRTPPEAEARLDYPSGTNVTIGRGTHVHLLEQSKKKRFALRAGSLRAKVAKLGPEERFVVATPDSEVEVHGTEFRVSVVTPDSACGGGTATRLEVTEGVVAIRHAAVETFVRAGETWPRCESVEPQPSPTSAPTERRVGVEPSAPRIVPHPAPPPVTSSSLVEENELYGEAMRAKRNGDADAALRALDRLVAAHPNGPLSESARIQRMRLLASRDHARAVAAAEDYLRRYPHGSGRAEAEALTAQQP